MRQKKRKIIKERAGELGHIDCHYLQKAVLPGKKIKYLVAVMDDCTRLLWAEVVDDITSITVMFATLRCLNMLQGEYNIRFEEVLTDNGVEFGGKKKGDKNQIFERMLMELGIKHRFTRAYRPQTNGKIERFWKTIEDQLLEDTDFDNQEELRKELVAYLHYYNTMRNHQGIGGKTPQEIRNLLPN